MRRERARKYQRIRWKIHREKADACSFPHYTNSRVKKIFIFLYRRDDGCVYSNSSLFVLLRLVRIETHIFSLLLPVKKIVFELKEVKNKWIIIKCQFFERFLQAWSFFCVVPRLNGSAFQPNNNCEWFYFSLHFSRVEMTLLAINVICIIF